jgi:hypothetical protein
MPSASTNCVVGMPKMLTLRANSRWGSIASG